MWGDLRGGKKSVFELRDTPESLTVTMQNPNIAMKKKSTYEGSKDTIKAKVRLCTYICMNLCAFVV